MTLHPLLRFATLLALTGCAATPHGETLATEPSPPSEVAVGGPTVEEVVTREVAPETDLRTPEASAPAPETPPPDTTRAVRIVAPDDYDPNVAYPVVLLLHGYAASAEIQDRYLGVSRRVNSQRFILLAPDGNLASNGNRFWNAGPACCDFEHSGVDDVAYLGALVDEVVATRNVDTTRIYVLGHSNGGFMAYRLACDLPERFAAVVSFAGAAPPTEAECRSASHDVSVLEIHGTADEVVAYEGSSGPRRFIPAAYPSAHETTRRFATRAGCSGQPVLDSPIDLEKNIAGAETRVERYEGCRPGTGVELWSTQGGRHVPALAPDATDRMLTWLFAHQRVTPALAP